MEHDNYEVNIENWASSLMEIEEGLEPESFTPRLPDTTSAPSTMPTYYRSKAFSSSIGINKLINAADPILTLATKLRRITVLPDPIVLHQNFCHEIRAFENKAQTQGYRPQFVMAARLIICALLDELLSITLWPELESQKHSLLDLFHKDDWDEDRFFLILDRSMLDPEGHIDLLELIYLCLRLGYEGKYRNMDRGLLELRTVTENLYLTISQFRDEFSRSLHIASESNYLIRKPKQNYAHLIPSVWLISIVMILALVVTFSLMYLRLVESSSSIANLLNSIQANTAKTKTLSTGME